MNFLASGYRSARKLDRALPLFEETLALRKAKLGPDHRETLVTWNSLVSAYQTAGKLDRALPLLRELADLWKRKAGADSLPYAAALASLGLNLLQQEKWSEAETVVREALAIRETKAAADWLTFNTQSMLGGALLGQEKYHDAEPLLRTGYEGMKVRAEKMPAASKPRLAESLDRLIGLAEATNKPDDARMWKEERAKLPAASAPKPEAEKP
jgi:tetratricopeptide (TPR) repeat protein